MHIKISNRLFFRQTRNAILVALLLGMVISIGQILFDFRAEQERIDQTVEQVLNTAKESASQAAYNLNNELAQKVVKGLFEYSPIYYARISDDFGRVLATMYRPPVQHDLNWIKPFLNNDQNLYAVSLYANEDQGLIGEMQVRIDQFLVAQNFFERAGLIILTGFLRNCILAIVFGFLFYFTLGRPVMQAVENLSRVDPANPKNTQLEVPASHKNDELGLLVEKINEILLGFGDTLEKHRLAEEELTRNQQTIRQLNQRLEERVRQRTSELEAANKEMEAFTYSVSHDLRAPLRTIGGFSAILQEEYENKLDEEAHHYLERVRAAAARMEHLIHDLLKLSRTTRGDLHRSHIDLSAIAYDVMLDLRQSNDERAITVEIMSNIKGFADKRFMRMVLENLLSNAWKYTIHTESPHISFSIKEQDGRTIYVVEDNGAGFDMNYADKLFSPFHRLHSAKEFEGTGVGLASVQRIIHRHGGEVWAKAEVNKGAAFYFTLPGEEVDLDPLGNEFVI